MSSPNQAATSAVSATQPAHASTIPRGTPDGKGRIGDRHHRWRHPGTAHKYSKVEHPLIMQIRATRRAERLFACVVLLAVSASACGFGELYGPVRGCPQDRRRGW